MSAAGARPGLVARLKDRVRAARGRRPLLDHAVRAYDRNSEILGGQLAAAITYFGFLSFFPLIAVALSVTSIVLRNNMELQNRVVDAINANLPGLTGSGSNQIDIRGIASTRGATATGVVGLVGIAGLVYTGTGWVDAVRDAMRRVFGVPRYQGNVVRKKAGDLVVLLLLGIAVLGSVVVSSFATSATGLALDVLDLNGSALATALFRSLAIALALALDVAIFAVLLSRLSGASLPWRRIRSGALLGGVGLEVLKLCGTTLVGRASRNPVYASIAVVVGLLVWINLVSRLTVLAAAWSATEAYSVEPGDSATGGAGRATAIAAATEPALVVAPPVGDPDAPAVVEAVGVRVRRGDGGRGKARPARFLPGLIVGGAAGLALGRVLGSGAKRSGPRDRDGRRGSKGGLH